MGWYRTPSGHVVQGDGSLERVFVARGYTEIGEVDALELVVEHQAHADLTAAEKAEAQRVLREEGLPRVAASPRAKPAKKTAAKPRRKDS